MSRAVSPVLNSAHEAAEDLDVFLGDPRNPEGPFSYRAMVEAEERNENPAGTLEAMREFGFEKFLVPEELGGRLHALDELFFICRTLSRRNLTVAVRYGSALLGANPVWLWGRDEQKKEVAQAILDGSLTCFGVSEADHGSDLRACEAHADKEGDDYLLTAEKWPVGNATRGRFVTTFAKTSAAGFSLLLVDKEALDPASWSTLPFVKTVGLRGHDLSGVSFEGSRLPQSAVLGREGTGLVQVLKALQITRTAISALSVGTMDATLRIALQYSRERNLYGSCIYNLPVIREHLVNGHIDLMISECVAVPVTKALSIAPDRMSLWSSVVKYFVPVMAEKTVASMAVVLGARSYLREGVADGVFQKLQRDHAIASIFEGTTHVNLHTIADQLPYVLKHGVGVAAQAAAEQDAERAETLARLFSLTDAAPRWEPRGMDLQLTNEGLDEITHGWDAAVQQVEKLAQDVASDTAVHAIAAILRDIDRVRARHHADIAGAQDRDGRSAQALTEAERHCVFHAMASCLYTWLTNRDTRGAAFADGGWLLLCLQRLAQQIRLPAELSEEHLPAVEEHMFTCLEEGETFSLLSLARPE
ncbi:acyl-CoA dehydrogenase family protein [Streptomyces halobius]|uniref:Acyl-CoA dehydrogenase n=1 Tax=Streptomyces halobius TaxID=2879846 RepID=A0ABY4M801_9ACTN|nr:acyl-CoA dehydrogenase family protein [Streptomyces halobius]UQA92491.1 acyl-CoA dehydrogenase [Streptomyces halobius]